MTDPPSSTDGSKPRSLGDRMAGHLSVMRADHWVKNVFVLPGVVVALMFDPSLASWRLVPALLLGLLCTCLVASSNYVLNEMLDAPYDINHPSKSSRPVVAGRIITWLLYVQWIALAVVGVGASALVSAGLAFTLAVLWLMGCIYNVPPVRSKDVPYVDVLSEAVNNPLRMLCGWFIAGATGLVPVSLLASYWMIGSYFMAIKRFAELRQIRDIEVASRYRKSFAFYNEDRLLVAITFYGSAAMLFFGAFAMRYRIELILAFPAIALVMAIYMRLGFKAESAAHSPEKLHREPALMSAVVSCTALLTLLLFVDIPIVERIFVPTPIRHQSVDSPR